MRKISLLISAGTLLCLLPSCLKDKCDATVKYVAMDPIYLTEAQFRTQTVQSIPAQPLKNPGKIYFYNDYVLINELREGIHVYDNKDPENPVQIAYLPIEGNVDIAVKNDVLMADSYVDLLFIDISNLAQPKLLTRMEDVFTLYGKGADGAYLVNYEAREVQELTSCDNVGVGQPWIIGNDRIFVDATFFDAVPQVNSGAKTDAALQASGIGGSLARFTLAGDRLYSVDHSTLYTFDVTDLQKPQQTNEMPIGWDIETIFPYDHYLFVGSQTGMYIFDRQDADHPVYISSYQHATACDPVYVDGNTAYVTLRDGTTCQNFSNELNVIDISNIYAPHQVATYPMEHPFGLSVAAGYLYICEGDAGVKVFDASDRLKIDENRVAHAKGFNAYDIITLPGEHAMVIGNDGFYQYDISDPTKFRQISVIPVQGE